MGSVNAELREQLEEVFGEADYPVENQMELVPLLPDGPMTRFEAGDVSITAMELASKLSHHQEFPYADAETMIDDVIEALEAEDIV